MAIQNLLELSTAHQPRGNTGEELSDYVLAEGEFDLFTYVPDPLETESNPMPEWYEKVCKFAISQECDYIRFTDYGEIYDELDQFEWD
jgi:hypothetical protein